MEISIAYYVEKRRLQIADGLEVEVLPRQIPIWLSIAKPSKWELPVDASRFVAILDTGFNGNLLIQEAHLSDWAGLSPTDLPLIGVTDVYGRQARVNECNLWIHQSQKSESPACLELDQGLIISPATLSKPRLPLLGLRAFEHAQGRIDINCSQRQVLIRF